MKQPLLVVLVLLLSVATTLCAQAEVSELLEKAQQLQQQQNWQQSIQVLKQAQEAAPNNPQVLWQLGEVSLRLQNSQGISYLQQAANLENSYQGYLRLARLAKKYQKFAAATQAYQKCLEFRETLEVLQALPPLLEEQGKWDLAWQFRVKRVEKELPAVRELKFQHEVVAGTKTKEKLREFLVKELDESLSEQNIHIAKSFFQAFGLAPEDLQLKEFYIRLLTEQIGGFYNPKTQRLYLIAEKPQKGFWEKLMQLPRDDSQDRMVLAHEMTHALQDQHFDLETLQESVAENDDRALALKALIEGDATVAMLEYLNGPISREQVATYQLTMKIISFLTPFLGGQELSQAPKIIREPLLFPYTEGFFFCLELKLRGGWDTINQAYQQFPASTEQILHPKKYLVDLPEDFIWPGHEQALGESWRLVVNNVMGELGCRILFSEYGQLQGDKIAAGWGGDRYFVYENEQGQLATVWLTSWDTAEDAQEFSQGYRNVLKQKWATREQKSPYYFWEQDNKVFLAKGINQATWQAILPSLKKLKVSNPLGENK